MPVIQSSCDPLQTLGTSHFLDLAVTGDVAVGDDLTVTGDTDVSGVVSVPVGTEHIGIPSLISASITYTPSTGTVATIGAGEEWIIHGVWIHVTTNFNCTGDNCTLTIGDGNDADGFMAAADAALQAAYTEATGYPAGYYGLENGSNGAYTVDEGKFIYAPTQAETIDYAVGGTSPAAGAATIYVLYTRIK